HPGRLLGHRPQRGLDGEQRRDGHQVEPEDEGSDPQQPPPEAPVVAPAHGAEERPFPADGRLEARLTRQRDAGHGLGQRRRRLWYTLLSITSAGCCCASLLSWTSAMSMSKRMARWPASRTRLCTQK